MIASRNNNLEIILLLLEAGAQLGKVDTAKRWSALHWATCYASTETVGYLLKAGATRYLLDTEWRTVVDLASEYKRRNIWQLLVAHHEIDRTPKKKALDEFESYYDDLKKRKEEERLQAIADAEEAERLANANKSMFDGWGKSFSSGFMGAKSFMGSGATKMLDKVKDTVKFGAKNDDM